MNWSLADFEDVLKRLSRMFEERAKAIDEAMGR